MKVSKPNFFVVGAPKCGTTSMYQYLRQHPEVFVSEVKEPYFFGSDLGLAPYWGIRNETDYLALFVDAGDAKRVGEASVWYLYSKTAAREIKEFNPSSKIIIMLRNPVDLLYSLHGQFLRSYNENIQSFEEALQAEEDRRQGRRIPRSAHFPRGLLYRDMVKFSEQLERYYDVFGRRNVFVVVFDDFVKDTPSVYRLLLRFLEVDPSFHPDFNLFNKSAPIRIRQARRFWKTRQGLQRNVDRLIGSYARRAFSDWIDGMGTSLTRPPTMKPETRARLQAEMASEVESLARLLDRDLSHWCRNP